MTHFYFFALTRIPCFRSKQNSWVSIPFDSLLRNSNQLSLNVWALSLWFFQAKRKQNNPLPSKKKSLSPSVLTYVTVFQFLSLYCSLSPSQLWPLYLGSTENKELKKPTTVFFFLTKSRNTQACLFFCFHLMISVYFSVTFTS